MEKLGHDVLSAKPEGDWKNYYQKYEVYGCKRCGYIFGIDNNQCIFILGTLSETMSRGQSFSFEQVQIRKYDEQCEKVTCEDLIVKGIIE